MRGRRRFGRPGSASLFGMMIVNAIAAAIVLPIVFLLFGVGHVLEASWAAQGVAAGSFLPMLPGAAIAFACLWYWLILVGRSRGTPWGGALVYGVVIAFCNVPVAGFVLGMLHGNPLLGLLLALASLLLLPALAPAMCVFGLTMGAFNAVLASLWIASHRPS